MCMNLILTINNVSFVNNQVFNWLEMYQTLTYDPGMFDDEGEGPKGGAIFVQNVQNLTCDYCLFINNTSGYQGGALWGTILYGDICISNSEFVNNVAETTYESAVYLADTQEDPMTRMCNLIMKNVSVTNNSAGNEGGSFYLFGCWTSIENCTFERNMAKSIGGAFSILNTDLNMQNVIIKNNSAAQIGRIGSSGGIMAQRRCTINISDSQFLYNVAEHDP